jgi:methenyltetrahydromethanopterin cyclohydrolase
MRMSQEHSTTPPPHAGHYANHPISIQEHVASLVDSLIEEAHLLRVKVSHSPEGSVIVDAGIEVPGGLEAGRLIAEICMGGLGTVDIEPTSGPSRLSLSVGSFEPILACLGSQYAGWSLSAGEGKAAFRALGSGPARSIALKEPLFAELGYTDTALDRTTLVLEVDRHPPAEVIEKVAHDTQLNPDQLVFILTPTRSLAGNLQVVARVLEVAMHKAHALGFDLSHIVDGRGAAPLPPPGVDFLTGMGRTNDAILYGGVIQLYVKGSDEAASDLATRLPSSHSSDYGKPFGQIFKDYKYDFYQIDPMLFAPAAVTVSNLDTGNSFHGGQINEVLLYQSFGTGS